MTITIQNRGLRLPRTTYLKMWHKQDVSPNRGTAVTLTILGCVLVKVAVDHPQCGICQSDRQPRATVLMALLLTSLPGLMETILRVPLSRNFSCLFTDIQLLSLLCEHIKLPGLFSFGGGMKGYSLTFINLLHRNISRYDVSWQR